MTILFDRSVSSAFFRNRKKDGIKYLLLRENMLKL